MTAQVKTGCTFFYKEKFCEQKFYGQTHASKQVVLKKRSRFTPSLIKVPLVWVFVKIVPFILFA